MRTIPSSELIINDDGSIFHLHLRPEQLADTVILVGDPGRVELVASFFDTRECNVSNREFNTVTGTYKGKRMTVLSTGIGIGNIDISVTELDALANVDFETRQVKPKLRRLTLLRLGTSGAIQPDIKVGEAVFSRMSIGFDGLLNYYKGRNEVCNLEYEQAFMRHTGWSDLLPKPYFAVADEGLFDLFRDSTREGITIAAPGFYAPQGRWVRLEPADAHLNRRSNRSSTKAVASPTSRWRARRSQAWPRSWGTAPRRSARSSHSASRWTPAPTINRSSNG